MNWRIALAALVISTPALARDNGQFGNVPPEIRAWFKSVKSHAGIPCCDISDGQKIVATGVRCFTNISPGAPG